MADANPRAVIGDNHPPEARAPEAAFDALRIHIEGLFAEAQGWLDGTPIETPEQAEAVGRLLDLFRDAETAADTARTAEKRPFDELAKAVQAKYAPLIGDTARAKGLTVRAIAGCKAALTQWRLAIQQREREVARRLQQEADATAVAALHAHRTADRADLAAADQVEAQLQDAMAGLRGAERAQKAAGKGHRLRDRWRITGYADRQNPDGGVTPGETLMVRHYLATRRAEIVAFCRSLAERDVAAGARQVPGCIIENQPQAY